jgi:hypothetical protein
MRILAAAAALAAVPLVLLAGCGDSGGDVAEDDLSPTAMIRQAATQAGGTSFAFTMDGKESGDTYQGTGEYSGGAQPAMHMTMKSPEGEMPGTAEVIVIGRTFWMNYGDSGLLATLPKGTWLKMTTSEENALGSDLDIRTLLQGLLATADVTEAGEEEIDGVSTRHYTGSVTAAAVAASTDIDPDIKKSLAEELRASEGDKADVGVWVDRDFQIRRYTQSGHDEDGDYTMSMSFSRFGETFDITAPPTSQVMDSAEFGKAFRQHTKDAARKVRAKYKTETEFRKACRAAEKRMGESLGAGDTPTMPSQRDQDLMVACSGMF